MAEQDEIKQFMARAMNTVPKEELKKFVVDTIASNKKVDWKTLAVPTCRQKRPAPAGPPAPSKHPKPTPQKVQKPPKNPLQYRPSAAPKFPPPPPTNRLPTPAELTQFQHFLQQAQSAGLPMPLPMGMPGGMPMLLPMGMPGTMPMAATGQAPNLGAPSKEDREMAEKRRQRFSNGQTAPRPTSAPVPSDAPLVGTCEKLEKQYLRLTSQPRPENVRPKRVLKKSLVHVLSKFGAEKSYSYLISQLKSIRQDINVQGIRDGFTVRVYETNARIALENRDLGEFNQCISRLSELYQDPQLSYTLNSSSGEFLSYHIYYILYTQAHQDLDIMLYKIQRTEELNKSPEIQASLRLVEAYLSHNTPVMFSIYKNAPPLAQIAMENIIRAERIRCLAALARSRKRSTIAMDELTPMLAFDSPQDTLEFVGSLTKHLEDGEIVCKDAYVDFDAAWAQVSRSKVDIKGQI